MDKTAVMGFGNPVRSDDAVGIYVIEKLQQRDELACLKSKLGFFDMGTAAFEVLFQLKEFNRFILIDAVINSNQKPGTVFKLPANEVLEAPEKDPMLFLHGMKWNQALSYAKKILADEYPDDIQVYLIAIENTKMDVKLSKEVEKSGDRVVQLILNDFREKCNNV